MGANGGEYFREGRVDAVAKTFPNLLSQSLRSEYLYGNTVLAVANLLRGTMSGTDESEYFREGRIDAVAKTFPNLLSQSLRSEYLYGNIVIAVADLLRGALTGANESEYLYRKNVLAVAAVIKSERVLADLERTGERRWKR